MDTTYRVRYRATEANGAIAALVVEDHSGNFYLFSGGRLQVRFNREAWLPRVDALLERARYQWLPVEGDAQIPLAELPSYIANLAPHPYSGGDAAAD